MPPSLLSSSSSFPHSLHVAFMSRHESTMALPLSPSSSLASPFSPFTLSSIASITLFTSHHRQPKCRSEYTRSRSNAGSHTFHFSAHFLPRAGHTVLNAATASSPRILEVLEYAAHRCLAFVRPFRRRVSIQEGRNNLDDTKLESKGTSGFVCRFSWELRAKHSRGQTFDGRFEDLSSFEQIFRETKDLRHL